MIFLEIVVLITFLGTAAAFLGTVVLGSPAIVINSEVLFLIV